MSCLCETTDPCKVILHVFCNKNEYGKVLSSIQKARNIREFGGLYCLNFKNPCTGKSITMKGQRILEIVEHPCRIRWCSEAERLLGAVLLNGDFFGQVLHSLPEAHQARTDARKYCKNFKIPCCLFPNVTKKCITMSGEDIIKTSCLALGQCCK